MTGGSAVLTLGDDVELHGITYRLTALDGDVAMLAVAGEAPVAIKVGSLLADGTFRIVGTRPTRRRIAGPSMLFDSLPPEVQERARWMEGHMTEVLDGVPAMQAQARWPDGPSTSHSHRCGSAYPLAAAAAVLKMTPGAAKTRMHRAKQRMKAALTGSTGTGAPLAHSHPTSVLEGERS